MSVSLEHQERVLAHQEAAMRDAMDANMDEPTRAAFYLVEQAARLAVIAEPEMRKLLEANSWADSAGAILQPTFYRTLMWSKKFAANLAMAKAAIAFAAAAREWDAAQAALRESGERS